MNKNPLTHLTLLFILITQHFQIIGQDLPRWEDFQPDLVSNRIDDAVLNSQGTTFLLSGDNFFELKEGKQFFRIEATDDIQPDHIEIEIMIRYGWCLRTTSSLKAIILRMVSIKMVCSPHSLGRILPDFQTTIVQMMITLLLSLSMPLGIVGSVLIMGM